MRLHWKTKKAWWWIDISPWWKSCRIGFWYDKWCGTAQLNIYLLFWEIEIQKDAISRWFETHKHLEPKKNDTEAD